MNKQALRKSATLTLLLVLLVVLLPLACDSASKLPPQAVFSAEPTSGTAPLIVQFTDHSTGTITSWEWDFDNDGTVDSTKQSPSYTYNSLGEYTVSLKITGPDGMDTVTKTNYVEVGSFIADFTADATTVKFKDAEAAQVQFTDQSTSIGGITLWEWDFNGDGITDSTDQNPSYTYDNTVDRYDVSLTVTGPKGTDTEIKAGYITVLAAEYAPAELRLSNQMAQKTQSELFADLVEEYTDSNVQVIIFSGWVMYGFNELAALSDGDVDIVWTHPFFLLQIDPRLDPFYGVPNLVVSNDHGRAILADGRINDIIDTELTTTLGIQTLGWFETILGGGYFLKQELTELTKDGLTGLKFGALYSGAIDPVQKWAGLEEFVLNHPADEVTAAAQGLYDVSITSWSHFIESGLMEPGLIDYFNHAYLLSNFSPLVALVNSDTWNGLDANTRDLINNIVIPEVQEYAYETALQEHKEAAKTINEECDTVNFQTPAKALEIFNTMLAGEYPALMERIAWFTASSSDVYDIILELRPANPQVDPDMLDILEYAGIPVPD